MFAGDHTERERIDHGNRAQTRSAMHAARDFAAGVEALDRGMGRGGDHLRIRVDHDAAHRVMDLRSDFNAVVRTLGQVEAVLELQDTVEFRVFLLGDEAVEAFNLFEERSLIDLEVVGKFFERIELLDRAHFDRQLHEGRINSLDDLFAGNGDRIIFILADDVEERVGLDLAASVFIHEALAGLAVNNDAEVHAGVVGEVHGNAKALFTRVGVGEELQPAELDRSSTDAERLDEHTGRGAELVRGVRGRNNARVLNLTEPNVAGETAGGKHDAELGADSLGLAGLVFEVIALELGVEAIAFAVGDAHNSIAVHDEVVELGAGLHRDVAELLDLVVHRVDVARAGAGLNFIGTRNGVAAFEEHVVGHEFGAAVLDKLDRVVAAVNDLREQFNVVEAETVFQAVSDEEFTAVLDALSLLHGVDRAGNVAAADGGVAADDRHFFEHQNLFAGAASLEGAGHTGKAGADDDDIVFFVILLNLGSGNACIGGSARHNAGGGSGASLEELARSAIPMLSGAMLMRGTKTMTRDQIEDAFTANKMDGSPFSFTTDREHLAAALKLVGELFTQSSYPEKEFETLKSQTIAGLKARSDEPATLGRDAITKHFNTYPQGDARYSETSAELIADLEKVTLADVKRYYNDVFGLGLGYIAVVGDFDAAEVTAELKADVIDQKAAKIPFERIVAEYRPVEPARFVIDTPDKENAMLFARVDLPANLSDADMPALITADWIIGGSDGLSNRIVNRLRQKEGLSYGSGSNITLPSFGNRAKWSVGAIVAPQNLAQAEKSLKDELARAYRDGITEAELAEAKRGIIGSRAVNRAQDGMVASNWVNNLETGRTWQFSKETEAAIEALTVEDVNKALRRFCDVSKLTFALAGDLAKAKAAGKDFTQP